MITSNGQSVSQTSVTPVTVRVMVNNSMRTLTKPEAGSELARKNRLGNWEEVSLNLRQFASYIEAGGTWRSAINKTSNKAKDVEMYHTIALDFDGEPYAEEPAGGPKGYCPFTKLQESIALVYRTLSWSEKKPYKERIVFVLSRAVTPAEYDALYKELLKIFNNADKACRDGIRFFYGSNQPVTLYQETTLDVDKLLANAPAEKENGNRAKTGGSKQSKKEARNENLSPSQFILRDILDRKLGGDVEALFCLWPHQFREREPDAEGAVLKLEGRNPFSATDSSGTSFVVTQLEGQLPIWHDRSHGKRSANDFNGGHGGTFLEYWYKLHPDFRQNPGRFSNAAVMSSIYRHFGVLLPPEMTIAHYQDILRYRLQYDLRMNALGDIVEYNGEEISSNLLTWFANNTDVHNERCQQLVWQCVRTVARENRYHPFIDRIKGLANKHRPNEKLWADCVNVLFGIPRSNPYFNLYTAYLQKFLLATLARVHYPGIKYDNALFLLGKQGRGKTTLLSYLIPVSYQYPHTEELGQLSRDAVMKARRGVLMLLDDMPSMADIGKKQAAAIKSMLSTRSYAIREPYAPDTINVPVSWVICGTSNADEASQMLVDPTGNRRFHLIPTDYCFTSDPAVPESLKHEICNTLWATAYAKFQELDHSCTDMMAQQLCIPAELWGLSTEHNEKYTARKLVVDRLEEILETKLGPNDNKVTLVQLVDWVAPNGITQDEKHQITSYLTKHGWKVVEDWYKNPATGRRTKKRVWQRPTAEETPLTSEETVEKADFTSYLEPVFEEVEAPVQTPTAPTSESQVSWERLSMLANKIEGALNGAKFDDEPAELLESNDVQDWEDMVEPAPAPKLSQSEAWAKLSSLSKKLKF